MSGVRRYPNLFIGGEWVAPRAGRMLPSIDPATEAVWAEVAEAGPEDVDRAVAAAGDALTGEWAAMPASRRGDLMLRLADWIQYYAGAADKVQGDTIPFAFMVQE